MVTRYTWSDSQINHIDFAKNLSGNSEATIFVSESTPAAALAELRETFNQQHIPTYLDVVGGKTVLKASGFSYPSAVLEAINGSSLVPGDSQMEEMAEDGKKQGLLQKIR
ncbi:MAG: hypothetical protein K2Q12_01680, partial [Rickettsiales bacterium]|nr:hypothetical protein [Rickettsiales bacterium]